MPPLSDLSRDELVSLHAQLTSAYDQLVARGLKLDLTRGKPAPIQASQRSHVLSIVGQFRNRIADVAQRGVRGMLAQSGQHRWCPAPGEFLERADVEIAVMEMFLQRRHLPVQEAAVLADRVAAHR